MAPIFFPPELAVQIEIGEGLAGGSGMGSDRLRELYFQRLRGEEKLFLDKELVALVLERARQVIAHPSRPTLRKLEVFPRQPFGELALEETLEESPQPSSPEDFWVEYEMEKPFSCVAMLDTSSSMSGEKHLLASIAVAVLLLEVPSTATALTLFASEATTIKKLSIEEPPATTILKFLRSHPRGFTNIHAGLAEGLAQFRKSTGWKKRVGLLATDGRTTEGEDPVEMARRFDFLTVLHLHGPGSHLEASQAIAAAGGGLCLEVERFEELPRRLYDALRVLARR